MDDTRTNDDTPEEPRGPQAPIGGSEHTEGGRAGTPGEPGTTPGEPGTGPERPGAEAPTEPMASAPPPGGSAPPAGAPPRRLLRSRSDRVIGGVCGGLGRHFNADPIIFRIAAVALALLGGAGVLIYLAALLLVPSEDGAGAPGTPPAEGRNRGLVVAGVVLLLLVAWPFLLGGGLLVAGLLIPLAVLVAAGVLVWWLVSGEGPSGDAGDIARRAALGIGVLVLCGLVAFGGAWAAAAGGGVVVGALVIAAAAALLAGAFMRPVRWLILPALALALSAGAVSAAGIDLDGGVGEREYRPASVTDLPDRYELGMGELVVDLRQTDLPAGDTPLEIDLGVGEARLIVPDDLCVATTAEVGVGEVVFFGRDNGGVDVDFAEQPDAEAGTSRLVVDAELGLGSLRVGREDFEYGGEDFEAGDSDFRFGRPDPPAEPFAAGNDACLETGESASR